MAIFNSYVNHYQRVTETFSPGGWGERSCWEEPELIQWIRWICGFAERWIWGHETSPYKYICTHVRAYIQTYIYIHMFIIYIYICVCVYTYVYIYIYDICLYLYMPTYIPYIHLIHCWLISWDGDEERERERERQICILIYCSSLRVPLSQS